MATQEAGHVRPVSEVLETLKLLEGKEDTGWVRCEDEKELQIAARVQHGRIETVMFRSDAKVGDEVLAVSVGGLGVIRYTKEKDRNARTKTDWHCQLQAVEREGAEISIIGSALEISVPDDERRLVYRIEEETHTDPVLFFEHMEREGAADCYLPVRCTVEHSAIQIGDVREG